MTEFNKLFKLPTATDEVLSLVESTIFKLFLDKKELDLKLIESRFKQKIDGTNYSVSLTDENDSNREKLIAQHLSLWITRHFKINSSKTDPYMFMGNIPLHITDFNPKRTLIPIKIYEELKSLNYNLYDQNKKEHIPLNDLDLFFKTILDNRYNLKSKRFDVYENHIEICKNEI